jgi:hypothetical protein
MDLIISLPKLEEKNVIIVVVYRLTKYAHFCTLSHLFNSSTVVAAFTEIIQKIHGNLKISVSDRDSIFTRKIWIELFLV